jgi:hypothetical protein
VRDDLQLRLVCAQNRHNSVGKQKQDVAHVRRIFQG